MGGSHGTRMVQLVQKVTVAQRSDQSVDAHHRDLAALQRDPVVAITKAVLSRHAAAHISPAVVVVLSPYQSLL